MAIPVTCGQCDKFYEVNEKGAGRKFKCKGCGAVLTVPEAPAVSESAPTVPQARREPASDEAPRKTKSAPSQASREAAPAAPSAKSASRSDGGTKSSSAGPKKKRSASRSSADGAKPASGKKSASASRAGKSSPGTTPRKKKKKKSGGAAAAASYELFDGDFEDDNDDANYEVADDAYDDYEDYSTDAYDDYGDDYQDADDYDDYEPEARRSASKPKKKRKKSKSKSSGGGGFGMSFNINRLNIALVVLGGMGIFFGIREARLAANSSSEPTTISAEELVANGPGENLYLTVTGIQGDLEETVIYYTETRGGDIQSIDEAFVPARPIGASPTDPIKLIVYSKNADTEVEVAGVASRSQHTGMIVNDIMSISGEKRTLLETTPYLTVDSAYILHEGRTPSGAALVILYFLGGGALIAGGLFWMFFVHD